MLNIDEAIEFLLKETGASLISCEDVPEDGARIILNLRFGENITNVNVERKRLRRIDDDARSILSRIKESLHRKE